MSALTEEGYALPRRVEGPVGVAPSAEKKEEEKKQRAGLGRDADGALGEASATVRTPTLEDLLAAQSPPDAPVTPEPPVMAMAGAASAAKAPVGIPSTAMAIELTAEEWRRAGRLPFVSEAEAPTPAARTLQGAVSPAKGYGETVPQGEGASRLHALARAATPFVKVPDFTAKRFASLMAEMRLWPARREQIWSRYKVSGAAARRALVEHWKGKMEREDGLGAEVEAGMEVWEGWCREVGWDEVVRVTAGGAGAR